MPVARDIPGAVFREGAAILLARIVDAADIPITQGSASAIEYSVFELNQFDPEDLTVVAGHDGVALDPADVLFDTLQTDAAWTVDATGYNFRHDLGGSGGEPFPRAGACYQVRYELTPVVGQKIVFRFKLRSL